MYFGCNYVSVGVFVCLFVCLLEPLHFLWNSVYLDCMGAVCGDFVQNMLDYVSECLSVGVFAACYVWELSGYVSECLSVGVSAVLFRLLKTGYLL